MTDKEATNIHILDTHTANCIAAGEVVERPASVVKELVENSLDAGATRIEVRVFDLECTKIQVADNGCGLSPADMRMAILRHATSKIRAAEDLEHLTTLGFRGEALPSIAAVSQMTITSRTADSDTGYTMTVDAGKAGLPTEAGCRQGTVILVDKLFYNAPVRRKFLKTPRTELRLIADYVANLAVSHPECAFSFRHGNTHAITTQGGGDVTAAIAAAFGRKTLLNLLKMPPVAQNGMELRGLVSPVGKAWPSRSHYHFFVNGRAVRCQDLNLALEEAYYTQLPGTYHPMVFLFLTLPPDSIDVNVHPAKLEIRLRDRQAVAALMRQGIKGAMDAKARAADIHAVNDAIYNVAVPPVLEKAPERAGAKAKKSAEPEQMSQMQLQQVLLNGVLGLTPDTPPQRPYFKRMQDSPCAQQQRLEDLQNRINQKEIPSDLDDDPLDEFAYSKPKPVTASPETDSNFHPNHALTTAAPSPETKPSPVSPDVQALPADRPDAALPSEDTQPRKFSYSALRVLGQHLGTYIICSDGRDLILIDQHAAAERIIYEQLAAKAAGTEVDSNLLAVPVNFSCSYQDHLLITEHIMELRDFGFILEYFGDTSYIIRGVPYWYENQEPDQLLYALLEQIRSGVNDSTRLRREELFMAACKKAIKANRYLTSQDISGLFAKLDACQDKYTCPHGRPIGITLTEKELRCRFLRSNA